MKFRRRLSVATLVMLPSLSATGCGNGECLQWTREYEVVERDVFNRPMLEAKRCLEARCDYGYKNCEGSCVDLGTECAWEKSAREQRAIDEKLKVAVVKCEGWAPALEGSGQCWRVGTTCGDRLSKDWDRDCGFTDRVYCRTTMPKPTAAKSAPATACYSSWDSCASSGEGCLAFERKR